ncbi:hypothetical protein [uncultured Sphingomonas sp.]|uniref:hypothetical protein n=1 Tax=uncultured Sphingomonas sp. TaxID=158754 RepID=UPI0025DC9DA1|nr:hypothetical protein [uncultured Sphingomonas sp.]
MASGLAGLSVATIAPPLLIREHSVAAWLSWAGCLTLFVCGTAWSLRGRREDDHRAPPDPVLERDARIAMPILLAILALMMILGTSFRALEPYCAAYSGTGGVLLTGGAVGGIFSPPIWALYQEPRQQLDMEARVALREGVELVDQVQNLTKAPFIVRQGVLRDYVNYYFPVGRTFWLGLSWKPKW